jgi:putative transposase
MELNSDDIYPNRISTQVIKYLGLRRSMLIGFKTELKLNNKQRTNLAKHAGVARHAYNLGLKATLEIIKHNLENPDNKLKFPSAIDLHKWLVASIKPICPWYYEVSKCAPQYALKALREAWDRCFKKTSNSPKFKKKGRYDSFTLDGIVKVTDHYKIQVPIIGQLKTYERLPFGFQPKSVTISKTAGRWFISYKIEVDTKESNSTTKVGVDLGVLRFATLSTGEQIDSPMPLRKLGKKLSKLQWRNRNKQLKSKNWQKAQLKIARLHNHISNIRKDFIHKLTTRLACDNQAIVIEDLNISGMMANHKLAKAIADCGFYEFRRQLEYKTKLYGSRLLLADRWFASSKTCNNCGCIKETLSLKERVFKCEDCGFEIDRDLNASLNLEALA